jgi:hypothetical protein
MFSPQYLTENGILMRLVEQNNLSFIPIHVRLHLINDIF